MSLARVLMSLGGRNRAELARRSQADLSNPFVLDPDELDRFRSALQVAPTPGNIILGRLPVVDDAGPAWIGLAARRFIAMHGSCVGASGAGKSFWLLACLLQILRLPRHALVLLDMKGETAGLLTTVILPALAAEGWVDPASTIRVIRPFDPEDVPLLRLTEPEPNVTKEVQALNLLTSIEESLSEPFGVRMGRAMLHATMLAIERREPLEVVRKWLHDREAFSRSARASDDPLIREYASGSLAKEQSSSIEAAAARLDEFLFDPATRAALAAPSCLSFPEVLESGITVVDLGDPPAGAERLARFWGAVILGRLTRAVLSRPVTERSARAWFVVDEVQEALGPKQAAQFSRLLSLARFKRVGLLLVNQEPGQVAGIDPLLASALKTNVGYRVAFRSNMEDARAFLHALSAGDDRRGSSSRERLVERLTRLQDRHFLFWLRSAGFRAQILRSPRLDLDRMKALAGSVPAEVLRKIRLGCVSVPRNELPPEANDANPVVSDAEFMRPSPSQDDDPSFPGLG